MRILLMPLSVLTCLAIASSLPVSGADPKSPPGNLEAPQFLRLHHDKDGGPIALETAIVRYSRGQNQPEQTVHVDLVAAVHIGERVLFDAE